MDPTSLVIVPLLERVIDQRRELKQKLDILTDVIQQLVAAPAGQESAIYPEATSAWEVFANALERVAGDALAIEQLQANIVVYSLGGQIIEYTRNLIDTATALRDRAPNGIQEPQALVADQPRAYENIQKAIASWFPSDVDTFKGLFRDAGLPTAGFSDLITASIPVVKSTAHVNSWENAITILHLSDLHRTEDEKVSNDEVYFDLTKSIKDNDLSPKIDLIVISGDITQQASEEEYKESLEFINKLIDVYELPKNRLITVPGNHDVNWKAAEKLPFSTRRGIPPNDGRTRLGLLSFKEGYTQPDEASIFTVFENFRAFYKTLYGEDYPAKLTDPFPIIKIPELKLDILCINTNAGMHHLSDRVNVDRKALIAALTELEKQPSDHLRIAVGHHGPVVKRDQHDAVDAWVFDRLSASNVRLYLHGHTHNSRCSKLTVSDGLGITTVGVGSLVAGGKERPEAVGRQYHIVRINLLGQIAKVAIRKKDELHSKWRKDFSYGPSQAKDEVSLSL